MDHLTTDLAGATTGYKKEQDERKRCGWYWKGKNSKAKWEFKAQLKGQMHSHKRKKGEDKNFFLNWGKQKHQSVRNFSMWDIYIYVLKEFYFIFNGVEGLLHVIQYNN